MLSPHCYCGKQMILLADCFDHCSHECPKCGRKYIFFHGFGSSKLIAKAYTNYMKIIGINYLYDKNHRHN